MKQVLIIESQVKRYRKPFYDLLFESLQRHGIRLRVVYSAPVSSEAQKHDNCDLPREYGAKVKALWLFNERLVFQPAFREILAADLVIVDQANKFIVNHLLLLLSLGGLKAVAFWGLGENLQEDRSAFSEWYKRRTINWVCWWFAYTQGTATYLQLQGVPAAKITVTQNAIDTRWIQACVRQISSDARASLRQRLRVAPSAPIGIYVGMLHKVKSVPFLIEAARRVQQTIREFQLIVMGGGPDEEELKGSAAHLPWVHFVGPQFGDRKSQFLSIADVFLLPGRVGLAILDGLAAGLPVIATRLAIHGPEVEYLEDGRNGALTAPEVSAYAAAITGVLSNPDQLSTLSEGARRSGQKYSIEAMVENFTQGILQCLARGQEASPVSDAREREMASALGRESDTQPTMLLKAEHEVSAD